MGGMWRPIGWEEGQRRYDVGGGVRFCLFVCLLVGFLVCFPAVVAKTKSMGALAGGLVPEDGVTTRVHVAARSS